MKKIFILIVPILWFVSWRIPADDYSIDISKKKLQIISGHLKLGTNKNPSGETLDANSFYFIKNGKPWFPVMGEFHFSRYPRGQWEESILKMKAAGIDIIATYVFWIYHEEEEGKWDWSGNRDLKYFASLCAKHNIYLFVRIGPWCHGEVRNGGFPDWLLNKNLKTRRNDSAYLDYVKNFFAQIHQQLKGFYFKGGGPIVGSQIENEYRFNNPAGLAHILALKKMAMDAGIDVPYYTATGWPGSDLKQNDLIPVWGAYPEAPWDKSTEKLKPSENYLFGILRSDPAIGSDILGAQKDTTNYSGYRYPYSTAEMGAGNEITYHRRPIIEANDVTSLAYVKIGSGANMMGYYMFHAGSNSIGKLSTLQESKATKYPNDYPIISYDFYSPIGEWGQLRPSYKNFKRLHLFLNDFGERLVQYSGSLPGKMPAGTTDNNTLRWSVRSDNKSGFIFISNYQRQVEMKDIEDVQFNITTSDGVVKIPENNMIIEKDAQMILPFNMDVEGATLKYATAQPLCILNNSTKCTYVFFSPVRITPEYVFRKKGITSLTSDQKIFTTDSTFKVIVNNPGMNTVVNLNNANGKKVEILTLTSSGALNAWKANVAGMERLFISSADIIFMKDEMRMQSADTSMHVYCYPAGKLDFGKSMKVSESKEGIFSHYTIKFPQKKISVFLTQEKNFTRSSQVLQPDTSQKSMPLYGATLSAIPLAKYWKVALPPDLLDGLSDAFLKFDYEGDTFAAYLDGKLVADDFYAGVPMTIGVKRFASDIQDKQFTILVTPLSPGRKIYFEDEVRKNLPHDDIAEMKKVWVIPQYELKVKFLK